MKDYNTRKSFLILSYTKNDEQVKEINKFLSLLEKSGVYEIIKKNISNEENTNDVGGRPTYNQFNMLAMILYSFAFSFSSLRELEDRCNNDLRVIYIMNYEQPTYKTIGNFINNIILPHADEIFHTVMKEILNECSLELDNVFIDGSKFEANCNKYKFVWKPTTYHINLSKKVIGIMDKYGITHTEDKSGIISSGQIAEAIISIDKILKEKVLNDIERKACQEAYNTLVNCLDKGKEYEMKERICGPNRKSYYKTDFDATAMCLKEDYYSGLGSNMHAAYNVQLCVSHGLISSFLVTNSRNDLYDFVPTLDKFYKNYGYYPKNVCADSGYGSLVNYAYMEEHSINNYVKHQSWEGEVSAKRPRQYNINDDESITCLGGKTASKLEEIPYHPKKSDTTFYKIKGCNNCNFKHYCKKFMKIKSENFKYFEINVPLQKYIKQAEENLLSPKGIELRVNRSCQVEGAFGIIKQDMGYERFRRITYDKVNLEFMLTALGYNIRKLFRYYKGENPFKYWVPSSELEPEKKKKPSYKRLNKKATKTKTKSVNQQAKSSYKY